MVPEDVNAPLWRQWFSCVKFLEMKENATRICCSELYKFSNTIILSVSAKSCVVYFIIGVSAIRNNCFWYIPSVLGLTRIEKNWHA